MKRSKRYLLYALSAGAALLAGSWIGVHYTDETMHQGEAYLVDITNDGVRDIVVRSSVNRGIVYVGQENAPYLGLDAWLEQQEMSEAEKTALRNSIDEKLNCFE